METEAVSSPSEVQFIELLGNQGGGGMGRFMCGQVAEAHSAHRGK